MEIDESKVVQSAERVERLDGLSYTGLQKLQAHGGGSRSQSDDGSRPDPSYLLLLDELFQLPVHFSNVDVPVSHQALFVDQDHRR